MPDGGNEQGAFTELVAIVRRLRAPGGCPWDRAQTHRSLRPFVLEEAKEVVDAIGAGNPHALAEELGDLLLQVLLHAAIAEEDGSFTLEDILRGLAAKLIRRHPHVFAAGSDDQELTPGEVEQGWARTKAMEAGLSAAAARAAAERSDWLAAVGRDLPALEEAVRLGRRAADVGFDWPSPEECWDKVEEERAEFLEAWRRRSEREMEAEFGDLLFSLVHVARLLGLDAEVALCGSNTKFRRRFGLMEAEVARQGRTLPQCSARELDVMWRLAKAAESRE